MALYQQIELSVTYFLKADEMNEQLETKPAFNNSLLLNLGETFFHSGEYEKCVTYVKKGLDNWHDTGATADYFRIRFWNTVGQAYKQLGLLDSAMANYQRSMQLVNKLNEPTWRGINSVNIGEVYLLRKDYPRAKQFIEYDYKVKYTDEPNVSAYGLQLLAGINLGRVIKTALAYIRKLCNYLQIQIIFRFKDELSQYTYHARGVP
jgi:tetratricopeptide (TPR) repeat protein